jgi:chromate reductase
MITIVAGTNRLASNTLKLAHVYQQVLEESGIESQILSLEGINVLNRDGHFEGIENKFIIPIQHFIFIVPEYNGSFPGILKAFIDTTRSHEIWFHKKALLTGDSSGRAGNLRGMDHLADILNFLKITVHPNKLPISQINKLMNPQGQLEDESTLKAIRQQVDEYLKWL